jgi:exopolyphosphatase / guanosine-5'-triphosphate,3'-diphosphate pyrophosphatase
VPSAAIESPIVAVIDIGSNSIKSLVAVRRPDGGLRALGAATIDARISAGISRAPPELSAAGMQIGLAAIRELLAAAAPLAPQRTVLVATSAVRDAVNGSEFCRRVREATGHEVRILSGGEEADLIGRGLLADPALAGLEDFYVFDLGGGSLECLAFRARRVEQAASLPLGCVRLTEQCVADSSGPFAAADAARVEHRVREVLSRSPFTFALPDGTEAVFAGGTVTTARAIFAARMRRTLQETSPLITVGELRALLTDAGALPLAERRKIPGLPAARADVFPVALATVVAVAEMGGFARFRHSLHNLRYGVAAELLGAAT